MEMKDLLEYPDYDSPIALNIIDAMAEQIATNIDNSVVNAIHKAGIDIDKDKFVSAMKQDKERYEEAYRHGFEGGYNKRDSDIIRCKDCQYSEYDPETDHLRCQHPFGLAGMTHGADWFCADGMEKE